MEVRALLGRWFLLLSVASYGNFNKKEENEKRWQNIQILKKLDSVYLQMLSVRQSKLGPSLDYPSLISNERQLLFWRTFVIKHSSSNQELRFLTSDV